LGAGGSEQETIVGLAASVHGGPAVDLCDISVHENLGRGERQGAADVDALQTFETMFLRQGKAGNLETPLQS
jgi:hypothetical protein